MTIDLDAFNAKLKRAVYAAYPRGVLAFLQDDVPQLVRELGELRELVARFRSRLEPYSYGCDTPKDHPDRIHRELEWAIFSIEGHRVWAQDLEECCKAMLTKLQHFDAMREALVDCVKLSFDDPNTSDGKWLAESQCATTNEVLLLLTKLGVIEWNGSNAGLFRIAQKDGGAS